MTSIALRAHALPANRLATRRRPRRLGAVAAAVLAFVLVAGSGSTAPAQATDLGTPAQRVDAAVIASPVPVVVLSPLFHGVVPLGGALSVSVNVQNDTAGQLLPTSATLELGRTPITSRATLAAWQAGAGDVPVGPLVPAATVAFESIAKGDSATTSMTVDAASAELAGLTPGVYPLRLRYGTEPDAPTSTSTMIVRDVDAAPAPFSIGIVVPITAPAIGAGLLSASELTALTGPSGSLTAALDAVTGTHAILAIDPAILAAIRVLGTAAPADALSWLERLDALPNERFATAFADGDLATAHAAQIGAPLRPTTLQPYMAPANFIPVPAPSPTATPGLNGAASTGSSDTSAAVPSPTPTSTPTTTPTAEPVDPTAPVFPTLDELLTVAGAHEGMAWPVTGTATMGLVERLTKVAGDAPGATLIASANTAAVAGLNTVAVRGTADGAPVLVYDSLVSAALRDAASVRDPLLRGSPLSAAAAQLALASANASGPLLVTVDRGADRSRLDLTAAIDAVLGTPGATPASLDELIATPPSKVELVDAAPVDARADAARRLTDTEASIAAFASILDDPTLLTGPERASIAQLLGAEWLSTEWPADPAVSADSEWAAAIAIHEQASATTLSSVGILPPSTTNLISSGAKLQFWVRNDLPYPVNVVFVTSPDDLRLEVERSTPVTALAKSNTRVEVPVLAKVGSGDVQLQLELRSPTLQPIGQPVTADVAVRADWEFIGIISLAVIVGGLFILGLIRTVMTRRKRRAEAEAGAEGESTADPEAEAETEATNG